MSYNRYVGLTKLDELKTAQATLYLGATLPTTAADFYGVAANDVDSVEWRGGEMAFLNGSAELSGQYTLFIQQATSGATADWYRLQDKFVAA